LVTSPTIASVFPPAARISSAARLSSSAPRALIATFAPSAANAAAIARPMPLLAPVTNTDFPFKLRFIL
jgi:hypothetical protein